jgi:AcrR family transcriptional regulator
MIAQVATKRTGSTALPGRADELRTDEHRSGRGRPRSLDADRAIADAAVELLMAESYRGLTMAAVAARAGVSTATLYRRYQNKDELVIDALKRRGDERQFPDTGSLPGDLQALLTLIMHSLRGDGGRMMEALIGETVRNKALAAQFQANLGTPHHDQLRHIFDAAIARGEMPEPADFSIMANQVVGPLYHRFLVTHEPLTPRVVDAMLPPILRALDHHPRPR